MLEPLVRVDSTVKEHVNAVVIYGYHVYNSSFFLLFYFSFIN